MKLNMNIYLISSEKVGSSMAGPGVRYFEVAKALSKHFNVTLLAPDHCDIKIDDFKIDCYDSKSSSRNINNLISKTDVIIAQNLRPPVLRQIKKLNIRYIADLYDPLMIEMLEQNKFESENIQNNIFNQVFYLQTLQIESADHILCASERQRDFYSGILFGRKIISPKLYNNSPDFKNMISLAPFGLDDKEPKMTDPEMIYKKFRQIKKSDKIILWGGGIWNWFDPLSVIKALELLSTKRGDLKMVFMGVKHPNPEIKQMKMSAKVIDYCNAHGLTDRLVFFNHDWTPYAERVNYLLTASIGVSTHFDNLETRFSFRTRILDYLWANLPMIVTEGDFMADFVLENKLGQVVGYQNINDIASAITYLLDNQKKYSDNIKAVKERFYWSNTVKELVEVIKEEKYFDRKKSSLKFISLMLKYYLASHK